MLINNHYSLYMQTNFLLKLNIIFGRLIDVASQFKPLPNIFDLVNFYNLVNYMTKPRNQR